MDPDRRMIQDGAVLMEGENILAVGKSDQVKSDFNWKTLINAHNKVVLPGFIDTHVHLSEHICRSLIPDDATDWMPNWLIPIYTNLTPEDEYYSSQLAFIEMIRTGTTTFCEAGTCLYPRTIAEGMREVGIRGILGSWTWDGPKSPDKFQQTTDQAIKTNSDLIEFVKKLGDNRIQAWPLLVGMGTASDELMIETKNLADQHKLGMGFMHASSIPSMESMDAIASLEHFAELGILDQNVKITHMVYTDNDDLDLLKKFDVKISHCPTAAMKHCKGISKYGRFPDMEARGICVSLGADSANGSDHTNMLRIIHLTAQIYKDSRMDYNVFPAETVLELATLRGAEALLAQKDIGSIEVGKKADLVFFDRDHPEWRPLLNPVNNLAYAVTDRSIDMVFISGKLVYNQGRVIGIDEFEVYAKVEELSRKVMDRAGINVNLKWPLV